MHTTVGTSRWQRTGLVLLLSLSLAILSTGCGTTGTKVASAAPSSPSGTTLTIANVTASGMATSGAMITWTTNVGGTSQVEYGTTTSYGAMTALNANLVTSHSQTLGGLSAGTTYHYRVHSKDASNNDVVSGDFNFTTTTAAGSTLTISNVTASGITTNSATIAWTTDQLATSQVEYGLTISYGSLTSLDTATVLSHSEQVSGLTTSARYHYRVHSKGANGVDVVSGDSTFTTTSAGSAGLFAQGWTQLGPATSNSLQSLVGSGVCASPSTFPGMNGGNFCASPSIQCTPVVWDWNSGVIRSNNQMMIWGGGHDAYGGNEIYAVDPEINAVWHRIADPTTPGACGCSSVPTSFPALPAQGYPNNCSPATGPLWGPNSRHTYGGLTYIPANADASGSNQEELMIYAGAPTSGTGGGSCDFWLYDLSQAPSSTAWTQFPAANVSTSGACDNGSGSIAFDPVTKAVFAHGYGNFGVLNPSTTTTLALSAALGGNLAPLTYRKLDGISNYYQTSLHNAVIDPVNRLYVMFHSVGQSDSSISVLEEFSLATPGDPTLYCTGSIGSACSGTGAQSMSGCPVNAALSSEAAGATFDTSLGKPVFYTPEDDNGIYIWDHASHSCTRETYGGTPPSVQTTCGGSDGRCPRGSFGRFAYIPSKGYYIYVSDADRAPFVLCRKPGGCSP